MDCAQELSGDVFICTECGEGFRLYSKLVEHMAIHGLFFPDALSINGSGSTNTAIEFALHENGTLTVVDRSVVSNFSCLFGKPSSKLSWCQTPNQAALTSSKLTEKEYAQFRCERCGQMFKSQKSLQLHQQYRVLEQGFKCTLCCKVFNERESLQSHLQNHAHERFYSCGHCGKRFLRQETLLSHKKQWHGSPGSKALRFQEDQENSMERSYPCKICGLRFFWLSDLQSHLSSHSRVNKPPNHATKQQVMRGDEEIKKNGMSRLKDCYSSQHPDENEEDESSDLQAKIKQQASAHNGKMRQMDSKQQMQRGSPVTPRMRGRPRGGNKVNHGAKLFSCKQCHRVFVHSSSLSRHMRYHKGTLHACVYCGRRFPQRCDVTRHVAMYHSSALQPKAYGATKTNESSKQENVKTSTQILDDRENEQKDLQEEDQHSSNVGDELSLDSQESGILKPRIKYKCKECSGVFGLLSVYKRHMSYHKRDPSRILLQCPHCPSRFTFRSALDRHIENHKECSKKDGTNLANSTLDKSENQHKDNDAGESNISANDSMASKVLYESNECSQT